MVALQDLCTGQLDSHSDVLSVTGGDAALASGAADGTVTLWRNAEEEGPEFFFMSFQCFFFRGSQWVNSFFDRICVRGSREFQ